VIVSRRVVVSLTPLLDMLLIVIFAQYIDLKGTSERTVARLQKTSAADLEAERQMRLKAERERDHAITLREETEKELQAQTKTIESLRMETDKLGAELAEARSKAAVEAEQARRDMEAAAEVLSDILKLPKEAFGEALKTLPLEERTAVRRELEDVRGKGVDKVIQHLRKLTALKKRCDFWEVFIDDDNTIVVKYGDMRFGPFTVESEDQFVLKMETIVGKMPEPKSLVIVLLSYAGAQRWIRREVESGLRRLCDVRLKAKYDGEKRFELAVLGFTTTSP
jgi:hypothetical protein